MTVNIGHRDNPDCPPLCTVEIEDLCDDMSDPDTSLNGQGADFKTDPKLLMKEVVALVRNLLESYRLQSLK